MKVAIKLAEGMPVVDYTGDNADMGRGTGSRWEACHIAIESFSDGGRQVVARMLIPEDILKTWPPEKIIQRFVAGFNGR
jgi:hypothetical protein